MYQDAARYYDLIHDARGRNAAAEAELVIGEIRRRRPDTHSLLDVGCGTGAHLPRFAEEFDVTGLDASSQMLDIARDRSPDTELVVGDFRSFNLGRRFDAIVCLFSGIGHLTEFDDLRRAIDNLASHLEPGGVLLVEGWVEPDYWRGSSVNAESGTGDGVAVARAVRSRREGVHCEIEMRYTIATPTELTTIDEQHRMRLSIPEEFEDAFTSAGVTIERLPHMLHAGRSVFAGVTQ